MRTNVWVYEAYPFLYQEMRAIEQAIRRVYGVEASYFREWVNGHHVDQIILTSGTKTTHQAIANTIKVMHLEQAILASRYETEVPTLENIQVVIGDQPEWASERKA